MSTINPDHLKQAEDFAKSINIQFNNPELIFKALVHRSFVNETNEEINHNERLEFLGDAVLELIITEYLFEKYPKRKEGELTSFRAALVRTESLAETSVTLNVGEYLFISKGEDLTGGRTKPYILANTYEAILGAIYLDQGYEKAREFVYSNLIYKIDKIIEYRLDIDNKSKLQELSQEQLGITPIYELLKSSGPDHNKTFEMKVLIGENEFGIGKGKNKQNAEQNAAKLALENWQSNLQKYKLNKNK